MEGLTEGRIVHYVDGNGAHVPAMIVHVCHFPESVTDNAICNLKVFFDAENGDRWFKSIYFDAARIRDTWHWIERTE